MTAMRPPVTVIAEVGVNHNGDLARAIEMVHVAADAGADMVKFQAFRAEGLVAGYADTAAYQRKNTAVSSQRELLLALELDLKEFAQIAQACREAAISFLCTPFAYEMTADLIALGMPAIKLPSGEVTNVEGLRHVAQFGLPVILSTGMSTLDEVVEAVGTLRESGASDITVLHCTSLYPAPQDTINLLAMQTIAQATGCPVGYSDHSLGHHISVAAVALGASVIEKHFTLDRTLPGPDHAASLEPAELKVMIDCLRGVTAALGDGIKQPHPDELPVRALVRRSWHAARALPAGHRLTAEDIVLKRPASGMAPRQNPQGRVLRQAIGMDKPLLASELD